MRPAGEIRAALLLAAQTLYAEQGAATWRQLAERSKVGYAAAKQTVRNMRRSGELRDVGVTKPAGSDRWQRLYEPVRVHRPYLPPAEMQQGADSVPAFKVTIKCSLAPEWADALRVACRR